VLLTAVNCMGVRESANLQNVLTFLKLMLVGVVVLMALGYTIQSPSTLEGNLSVAHAFNGSKGYKGFFTSMVRI